MEPFTGNRIQIRRLFFWRQIGKCLLRVTKTPDKIIVGIPGQRLTQRLLTVKLSVERSGSDACGFDDSAQGSAPEPLFEKFLHGCGQE